jgi:predicted transcriptional regulator
MNLIRISLICMLLAGALPVYAQRDFLTSDEIEKVREAQVPSERLKLDTLFARQRIDQLQRLLEKEKKGRSLTARQLLEDYANIVEAIDTVSDDALKRGVDIAEGTSAVGESEKRFLATLQKIKERAPADLDLFDIALKEAIATTSDSIDLAKEDLGNRAATLTAEEKKAKEERDSLIASEDARGKSPEDVKAATAAKADESKPARKPPTLYRKGEKPDPPK